MGCCGGSVPVRPGGICRATTSTGKRSTTGIAAGQRRGPGPRFSRSRAVVVIRTPRLASRCSGRWGSNDKESSANTDREALGRSRGGLTTTVHVAADQRCPPTSRVITPGQRHDSVAFEPVMAGARIRRRGLGRPRTRPERVLGDKAYPSRPLRAHPRSTPRPPNSATSSNAASTSTNTSGQSPPVTTNASTSSPEPSTPPRSGSGSATPSHDPEHTA